MTTTASPTDLARALRALRKHLEYLKEEGVTEVEVSRATLTALKLRAKAAPTRPAPRMMPAAAPAPRPATAQPAAPQPAKAATGDAVSAGLAAIAREVAACRACRLCEKRTNVVPGQGNPHPEIMFIGEGPGADEDEQGLAFVGRAGQLLTSIINAMGFSRDEVFIGNVVKCRPPDNRTPAPDEMAACLPYLARQIDLLKPKLIVALGATAVKGLFNDEKIAITKQRGNWMNYRGIDVMPTFHPAYLLRNPPAKREVWMDMKTVLAKLGRQAPTKG
jgi:uracil-DNA glycosylase family 4